MPIFDSAQRVRNASDFGSAQRAQRARNGCATPRNAEPKSSAQRAQRAYVVCPVRCAFMAGG